MPSYAIMVIPVAHAPAINRIMNDHFQDSGDNLGQPLSVSGQDPATHKFGGGYVDAEWLAIFQNLETVPYVPRNGYPLFEGTEMETSEADALAAQEAFTPFVATDPLDDSQLVSAATAMMVAATGLQVIEPPL